MYKITISGKYNLLKYSVVSSSYIFIESFNSIGQLKLYVKRKGIFINLKEIDIANKFVEDTTHNSMEFGGIAGLFTVSYYDEGIEE